MYVLDFETKSEVDLKKTGAWVYSQHPSTEIICACWTDANEPAGVVTSWVPGDYQCPPDDVVMAFNSGFEQSIWENICVPRYGWPTEVEWLDIAAVCRYFAFPRDLAGCLQAMGIDGKLESGAALITKYSKLYLPTAKREIPPEDLGRFIDYCSMDVIQTRKLYLALGWLPEDEEPCYNIHRSISRFGMHLDQVGLDTARRVREDAQEKATTEFHALTGLAPTQRDAFLKWCEGRGVALENMQAEYLEGELPYIEDPPTRKAIKLRQAVAKTSTTKLDAMRRNSDRDSRARFQTIYHGARTGRETGTGIQPLNFPKGFEKSDPEGALLNIAEGAEWLDMVYGNALDAIAASLRHYITASPGQTLFVGDFVSIEAVVLAALAGHEGRLQMFRDGGKVYERTADAIFKLPPGTVTKDTHPKERQVGKIGELACGYQGSVGAWRRFDKSDAHTDEEVKSYVTMWRLDNPAIVGFWKDLERAAMRCVRTGKLQEVKGLLFEMDGSWMSIRLLNGKKIWYFDPKVRLRLPGWHKPKPVGEELAEPECEAGVCGHEPSPAVTYMNAARGQWFRDSGYGGKWAENVTQATAREWLYAAMHQVDCEGWHKPDKGCGIILSVYDEIVLDAPLSLLTEARFKEVMGRKPSWGSDWPIGVDTWVGERYKK